MRSTFARGLLLTLCAFALASASADDGRTVRGPEVDLFGGTISSYAELDANGEVIEAGIVVPLAALEAAPADAAGHDHGVTVVDFPAEVQASTFLNHLGLFWNPVGHEPEVRYGVPHWDLHFFAIPSTEAAAIDCSDPSQGDPVLIGAGWLPPVPPDAPADAFCVPLMGYHSLPATEFEASGEFRDGLFDKVMIGGYYRGSFIFLEPMITQELLLERQSFDLPLPRPVRLERRTRYPGSFEAVYDAATDAYTFVLGDFSDIE